VVALGVITGIAGSVAITRVLSGFLFGIKPMDPITFLAVPLLLATVALLASYIPARRATKVDPMIALRYE
jgi:putative ABC transport system permease protein